MKFYEEFQTLTDHKYDYLRLQSVEVYPALSEVKITFVLPYEILRDRLSDVDFTAIKTAVERLMPTGYGVKIQYSKCTPDEEIVKSFVLQYLKQNQKALTGQFNEDKIAVKIEGETIKVSVPVSAYSYEYCKSAGVDRKLKDFLDTRYSAQNAVTFEIDDTIDTGAIIEKEYEELYVDTGTIDTSSLRFAVGKKMDGTPRYISKFDKPQEGICVCGRIAKIERNVSKKNNRIFYSFVIDDTTGEMACMYFGRSTTKGALDFLQADDCVVMNGDLVEDTFRNKGNKLMVRTLALCKIDFEGIQARKEALAKHTQQKKKVFSHPQPYVDTTVKSLMDMAQKDCEFITQNDFVVFDLETTGLDSQKDRVVEIGAVKIEKGEIVSYYGTFVDPQTPIPASASQVNHIYDQDVKDAPYIEDVIEEFLDYCKGCIVVAHNASFDVAFIARDALSVGRTFDNRVVDSLRLAKKLRPDLGRFNLGYLCRLYDVDLTNAHRAYYDAEATGRLLIKMANRAGLNRDGEISAQTERDDQL